MTITNVYLGAEENDGSGDAIRDAFSKVNDNFSYLSDAVLSGTESTIISAFSLTAGSIISNTYVLVDTYVNADAIVGNTVTSNGNLFVSTDGAYIIGNLTVIGNLSVSGSQAAAQAQASTASLLNLHYSAVPLVVDDDRDIGLVWQYYTSGLEKKAFLGWQNSTESLIYWDNITESVGNVITSGVPGNVQVGSMLIANTTAATSNVTGALRVLGGVSVQGNLYVLSNIVADRANIGNVSFGWHEGVLNFGGSDTIYINGSPVQTAAQAFNGGTIGLPTIFQSATSSTGLGTGAVRIVGGLSANGNAYIGGNIVVADITGNILGNITGNIIGNILTNSQPYITSLGSLSTLSMAGQINAQNIVPLSNLTHTLGTGNTTRWLKIWTYDLDVSGTLTGVIAGSGGTFTGNIGINTSTNAGLTTTQPNAYLFNENATTVKIAGGGVADFDNNTQATSTSTGAIQLKGGMSINSGNLYIGGSGGRAIIATGNIIPSSNNSVSNNIGSDTAWWNTFYGVSTQARYADLAEHYKPDAEYSAGTVLVFGGDEEVTVTNMFADHRVAGVVSTDPAYLMNAASPGIPVALRGRVPVKVIGPVTKGDLLVTSNTAGTAISVGNDASFGIKIFAKSLVTSNDENERIIEAVIL